jgi:hypothetical protein
MDMIDCDMCSEKPYKKENRLFCKACRSEKSKIRACQKCKNDDKFMMKHSDMCEAICPEDSMTDDMAEDVAEDVKKKINKKNKVNKKKDTKKTTTKKDTTKKDTTKKTSTKKTSTKKASSLVVDMDDDVEDDVEEIEDVVIEKTQQEIDDEKLGIFGKVLRALIVANTW